MNTKLSFLLATFLMIFTSVSIYAQKEIKETDIEFIEQEDGLMYIYEKGNYNKPIEGKIRIITDVTTEYVDAELKSGYPDGEWKYYRNNRLKEIFRFKNGYLDGKQYLYFGNGDLQHEISYEKGKKHGEWIMYYSGGGRRELEVYEDDLLTKRNDYYTNGNIRSERNFKNGEKYGFWRTYTEGGVLEAEQIFVDGKQTGHERMLLVGDDGMYLRTCTYGENGYYEGVYSEDWVENNTPKVRGKYVNGRRDGKWTEWNSNGSIRCEEVYKNGVKQDK